jgi:hypothetical protein
MKRYIKTKKKKIQEEKVKKNKNPGWVITSTA